MIKSRKKFIPFVLIPFILLLFFTSGGSAYEVTWVDKGTYTLYADEMVSIEEFEVAADFDVQDFVHLTTYKDNSPVQEDVLGIGDEGIFNDEIKLVVIDMFSGNNLGWVEVDVYVRARSDMRISITTDKNEYKPSDTIVATLTVRNYGKDNIENIHLNINPGLLELTDGSLIHNFNEIPSGKSESVTIEFKVPLSTELEYFTIEANASGVDVANSDLFYSASKRINLLPMQDLEITKTLTDTISIGDSVIAYIKIKNTGASDLTFIEVIDKVPEGFELENGNLRWNLNLRHGEEKRLSYLLKSIAPGTYNIPAVIVQYKIHGTNYIAESESGTSQITVQGPRLVLTKTVDQAIATPGDQIKVTVSVRNEGEMQTIINITDSVPPNTELLSGNLNYTGILDKNESQSYSYIIKIQNIGETQLPPATIDFSAQDLNYNATLSSGKPTVFIVEPFADVTEITEISSKGSDVAGRKSLPGFGGLLLIAVILICSKTGKK